MMGLERLMFDEEKYLDKVAIEAMKITHVPPVKREGDRCYGIMARKAYDIAEAMLAEKKKRYCKQEKGTEKPF